MHAKIIVIYNIMAENLLFYHNKMLPRNMESFIEVSSKIWIIISYNILNCNLFFYPAIFEKINKHE
jgi:hypothetical protein